MEASYFIRGKNLKNYDVGRNLTNFYLIRDHAV